MITNKIISNKFYKFGDDIVKVVKILKSQNKLVMINLSNMEESNMPLEQADLILQRRRDQTLGVLGIPLCGTSHQA